MKHLSALFALFALVLAMSSAAVAQNEEWVDLGWFGNNSFQAAYDAAGARTESDGSGGVMVYVKMTSASREFVEQEGLDPRASYYSENFGVDCAHRVVRSYHLLSHDAQGGWVQFKDIDFKGSANTPIGDSLGGVLLQKICGS